VIVTEPDSRDHVLCRREERLREGVVVLKEPPW
jgi:hypothetical protein